MNELVKSTQDAVNLGEVFFKSAMFADIKSASQAVVKILAGQEVGIPPLASMTGIHIISGKTVIGAGLMASRVKSFGKYDYRVLEMTDTICRIEFFHAKESLGISTFSIEDAKRAGTKNLDKFPRNMLFARAMSNGVKWFTPDIYSQPVYVPEEMEPEVKVIESKLDLTDAQLKKVLERIAKGELDIIEKAASKFNISDEQMEQINNHVNAHHNGQ